MKEDLQELRDDPLWALFLAGSVTGFLTLALLLFIA